MPLSQFLDSFDSLATPADESPTEINQVALESERLASFEQGYSAGWEDAAKAQADDRKKISSDLAQNLQDMSFTYHEAVAHLNKAVEPLLQDIIEKVLPKVGRDTLGLQIVEQLIDLTKAHAQAPVQITVCPAQIEAVEALLEGGIQAPFEVISEPTLGEGQAYIKFGNTEREIDTSQVIEDIETALAAFIHQNKKEALRA